MAQTFSAETLDSIAGLRLRLRINDNGVVTTKVAQDTEGYGTSAGSISWIRAAA